MPKKQTEDSAPVDARVLTDCALGKANDVVQVDLKMVEAYVQGSYIDTNPEAVAYAMTLQKKD